MTLGILLIIYVALNTILMYIGVTRYHPEFAICNNSGEFIVMIIGTFIGVLALAPLCIIFIVRNIILNLTKGSFK